MSPIPTMSEEDFKKEYGPINVEPENNGNTLENEDLDLLISVEFLYEDLLKDQRLIPLFEKFPFLLQLNEKPFVLDSMSRLGYRDESQTLVNYYKQFSSEYFDNPEQIPIMEESISIQKVRSKDLGNIYMLKIHIFKSGRIMEGFWILGDNASILEREWVNLGNRHMNGLNVTQTNKIQAVDQIVESNDMFFFFPKYLNIEQLTEALESGLPTPVSLFDQAEQSRRG